MPSHDTNAAVVGAAPATQQQHPRPPRTTPHHHHNHNQSAVAANVESIPCPRCDSRSTKFCYYNNYNLSQPRHFCKSCRRYWTHGGTLRNIPVGGGTHKSATSASINSSSSSATSSNKRPRYSPAVVSPCTSSSALSVHIDSGSASGAPRAGSVGVNGDTAVSHGVGCGVGGGLGLGFSSSLPNATGSNTFLALGGYVPALDGMGFSFSRGVWPFSDAGLDEGAGYGSFRGPILGPAGVESWNVGSGISNSARDGEVVVSLGGRSDGRGILPLARAGHINAWPGTKVRNDLKLFKP